MKKNRSLFWILSLLATPVFAQLETANWFFGDKCGLSWQDGSATPLLTGAIQHREGVSSISDCRGNLLLYSDGKTVWNRHHTPMPNGNDLIGHYSATQGATIIRQPGHCNRYYIFTLDGKEHNYADGLHYSVVDLSLQGGLGDVVEKNVLLYKPSTEKLTAVKHANGIDIWIITHVMFSNEFKVYLLTTSGIEPDPVLCVAGTDLFHIEGIGQMKASPDGKKLAFVTMYPKGLELFDFDDATGIVSNPRDILVETLPGDGTYGLEFSPNSSLLFFTQYDVDYLNQPGYLYQLDTEAGTAELILASAQQVGANVPLTDMRGLQLGPDGKIYVSRSLGKHLGVIEWPDTPGLGCNYVDLGISLDNRVPGWTLPNFMVSYFQPGVSTQVEADFQWGAQRVCKDEPVSFTFQNEIEGVQFHWDFGDGGQSALSSPTHLYRNTGAYEVQLIASKACCADTTIQTITVINCNTAVYIPNAFSPNGDGINDLLMVYGPTVVFMHFSVFDRWGEKVFESHTPEMGWDGFFKNKPAAEGIYAYVLQATFEDGTSRMVTDHVTLLR